MDICKIFINDFFSKTSYNYNELNNKLFEINLLTKTRHDPNKKHITEHFGIEQSYLLYYIADKLNIQNFIEIGTGRGTTSYSIALKDTVKEIHTFDIIPFNQKMNSAIKFKQSYISNMDIYNLIPYNEKNKIKFYNINELNNNYKKIYHKKFDLAFIDGNHDNYNIIMNDFLNCNSLTTDNAVIIFDDYMNFPVVTNVVNDIIKKYKDYKYILIPFRGHLFMKDKKDNSSGELLLFKNPIIANKYFNLFK